MLRERTRNRNPTKPARTASVAGRRPAGEHSRTAREESPTPVVLIVERDRLLRWALYETLTDAGFRVLTAPEGLSAAALIGQIDQDLSVAFVDDESWPLTASACACLRERRPTLPIVAIFEEADERAEQRAKAHGAVGVLEKPFDLHEVVALAEQLSGRASTTVAVP